MATETQRMLKEPPRRDQVAALVAEIEPGVRRFSVSTLHGGLGCSSHAITMATLTGTIRKVVLRRYHDNWGVPAARCRGEWRTLKLLKPAGILAPEPIWLDADGRLFGQPALVEFRVRGHALLAPSDLDRYLSDLAEALVGVHEIRPTGRRWEHLEDKCTAIERRVNEGISERRLRHPKAQPVFERLCALWPKVPRDDHRLLHDDYWPGNTVWFRGRLSGIVDWEGAASGDPAFDVAYCRLDLSMLFGLEAADRFQAYYERHSGDRLEHVAFWELEAAIRAMPDVSTWIPGYLDFGRSDITPALMRRRHDEFITNALARAR